MKPDVRRWLIVVAAVLVAFLIGYAWQRMRAGGFEERLQDTSRELELQRIESTLGAAAIEAHSGSFEIARQHASDFFTRLQAQLDSMPAAMQPEMRELLSRRDALITALSRNDVQSGPQLGQMFRRYRTAMGETVGPTGGILPAPATPDTGVGTDTSEVGPGPGPGPDTTGAAVDTVADGA